MDRDNRTSRRDGSLTLNRFFVSYNAQLYIQIPLQPDASTATGDSSPGRGFFCLAGVAQLVEQLICNQQVAGSSPIASSGGESIRAGSEAVKRNRL